MIKIFDLGNDWYAAETVEEAIECYVGDMTFSSSSYTRDEVLDELVQDPHEETNLERPVCEEGEVVGTFATVLAQMVRNGVQFPIFFASMEY